MKRKNKPFAKNKKQCYNLSSESLESWGIMEQSFEREVLDRLTRIETKIEDYNNIKEKTEEAYVKSRANEKDIAEINDKIKWITRLVAGAIITGVIGVIFALIQK